MFLVVITKSHRWKPTLFPNSHQFEQQPSGILDPHSPLICSSWPFDQKQWKLNLSFFTWVFQLFIFSLRFSLSWFFKAYLVLNATNIADMSPHSFCHKYFHGIFFRMIYTLWCFDCMNLRVLLGWQLGLTVLLSDSLTVTVCSILTLSFLIFLSRKTHFWILASLPHTTQEF